MSNCCYPPTTGDLCRDCALAEVVRLQKRCTSAELERNSLKASLELATKWLERLQGHHACPCGDGRKCDIHVDVEVALFQLKSSTGKNNPLPSKPESGTP